MVFLYPIFLFGLLALLIPIIIHLFNFRKTRKIFFSNNKFLKNVKESSSSKTKLKHILVLACRLLFIAFLVFAFAQPFIPGKNDEVNQKSVYLYLDNSFSMSTKINQEQSALDLGISYLNELINVYPANTEFVLLTNEFFSFSNTKKSAEKIRDAATEIVLSPISRSLDEILNRFERNEDNSESSDIYIISDFQKSTIGDLNKLTLDSVNKYSFIPLVSGREGNVFVDSIFLSKPFILSGQNNELEVSLFNTSEDDMDELAVKLFINGVQVANSSLSIGSKSHNALKFDIPPGLLKKSNRCTITFEEFPVSFDNEVYFSLNTSDKISILEIKSESAVTNIEKVFSNQDIFNFSTFHVNNLDYNRVKNSDLIVLNTIQDLSSSLASSISDYLTAGGHLLLIPSENINANSYQNVLGAVRFSSNPESVLTSLSPPDFSNPFYDNVFEESSATLDMPEARRTISWSSNTNNLLTFRNGQPFLSEIDGLGKVYILGAPLTSAHTNFHKHALFVPVMYKIATLSKSFNEKLAYSVREPVISLKLDSLSKNQVFKLTNEDQELIPNQRIVGSNLIVEVPKNELHAGFYDLRTDDSVKKTLAFNYDKAESMTESYLEEELTEIFSGYENVNFFGTDNQSKFTTEIKQANFGISLWEYAILLALFFLLCEILILRFL